MPPVIRPAATSIAPCQMTRVIAPNIRKMTIAVMTARSRMRRLAVANTRSTASAKRDRFAALLVECLDDLHRAEHFAGDGADVGDAVLAAARDLRALAARGGRSGTTTSGTPSSISTASFGASANRMTMHADAEDDVAQRHRDGGADDLLDDRRVDRHAAR